MIILVLRLQDLKSYDGQMGRNFTWPSVSRIILKLPEFGTCTGVGEKLIFYQFLNLFEASSPFFVLHPSYSCCFGRFTPWTVYKGNVCWPFFVLGDEFLLPSSTTNFLCIVENHHFFMRDYYLIEHESASNLFSKWQSHMFFCNDPYLGVIHKGGVRECPPSNLRQVKWNCAKPKRPWGMRNVHRRSIKRPLLLVRFVSLVVDGVISHFKWLCRLNSET